ncbi:MAG: fructose-bisphosphatase class III [Coriobacteriales bacterium]|jgi:fructose-1,6-bisphosphatase-3
MDRNDLRDMRYLELLSHAYPTAADASAALASRRGKLCLPRGTEIFVSDIHGEYAAFAHIVRNGCGKIRKLVDEEFSDELDESQRASLATLACYPSEKIEVELSQAEDRGTCLATAIMQLARLCRRAMSGHSYLDVISLLPAGFELAIEELLLAKLHGDSSDEYAEQVVWGIVDSGEAPGMIEALAQLLGDLVVSRVHMLGDVYDRGPAPDKIMDELMEMSSVDVQWGNHDVVWMGASLGQVGCISHVVRNCARYGNMSILTDAYGMDISSVVDFAQSAYADDPCVGFELKEDPGLSPEEHDICVKIQKAMAIIQFKVEAKLIDDNPSFGLESRKLLDKIDFDKGTVVVDGKEFELTDKVFPTVDPSDPYRLTAEEERVVEDLESEFVNCSKLQEHISLFLQKGSLYRIRNGNLLLHACVPLNADGSLKEVDIYGERLKGRELFDAVDRYVREAFSSFDDRRRKRGADLLWYLWLGEGSPLFAKSKMATFEIYLVNDSGARKEVKNPFYSLLDDDSAIDEIFEDFGMDPATSRIICGHVPVKVKDGEDPVKCGGRVLVIDGGFSPAYQSKTGIAGFALVEDSHGVVLHSLEPLESTEAAIERDVDIKTMPRVVEQFDEEVTVADTDDGAAICDEIVSLQDLVYSYENGTMQEGEEL